MNSNIYNKGLNQVFNDMITQSEVQKEVYASLNTTAKEMTTCELFKPQSLAPGDLTICYGIYIDDTIMLLMDAQYYWTPNYPMIAMMNLGEVLEKWMEHNPKWRYGYKFPKIQAYIMYQGNEDVPEIVSLIDRQVLLQQGSGINLNLTVIRTLDVSTTMGQYLEFLKIMKPYLNDDRESIEEGIEICIHQGILKDYLNEHKKTLIELMCQKKSNPCRILQGCFYSSYFK